MSILQVSNLSITDTSSNTVLIENSSFSLAPHECLGIVGESGSGKSITCKGILGLLPPYLRVSGNVVFKGREILQIDKKTMRAIRGKQIAMIPQDAMSAFDPLYTIGYQMIETLVEKLGIDKKESIALASRCLLEMRLYNPQEILKKYPHELSGGMLQRCIIAISLALEPDVIIADEITSALDSINQREVAETFKKLKSVRHAAIIFVSHDLGVVRYITDRVAVMTGGKIVEYGASEDVFEHPKHEYTRYLINTKRKLSENFDKAIMECKK